MDSTHFFKIIVNRHLQAGKLMLPKKFINDYGSFLSSSICLKLPNGLEWRVGLATDSNGTVWLQNGWHEFSQHHGLKFGSLLVFRLDGNSTFHILIFDTNGSEIQYPCKFNHSYEEFETEEDDDDDYLFLKNPKEEEYIVSRERVSRRIKPEKDPSNNSKADSKTIGFKVVLKKSTVKGRFNMSIPKKFARKYMNEKFGILKFQNSDGSKSWPMVYKWGKSHRIDYAYISSGWKRFAEENHLREGDILFFQMIRKDHFIFTKEESSLSPSPKKSYMAAASSLTDDSNPSFKVNIRIKSYKNSVQNIPLTFAQIHLSATMHTATLIVGVNKQWTVRMKEYAQCFRFSAGWAKFYRENRLEYGDSCFFELVRKNESCCVFKVDIIKKPSKSSPVYINSD